MMESKAYTQAYVIIANLNEDLKKKIPPKVINAIKSKMDSSYEFYITDEDIENIEILEDTEKLLSVIYTDYLASEEERKVIQGKEKIALLKEDAKKREKYSTDVFQRIKNKKGE